MDNIKIPNDSHRFLSPLIKDYLNNEVPDHWHNGLPTLENLRSQAVLKLDDYNRADVNRKQLATSIISQYTGIEKTEPVNKNILELADDNTVTITTGHQLNLFSGPVYFLYKIITTINLCKEASAAFPEFNFVPIYWMATEDHDFEEIQYFNFGDKKIVFNSEESGAVGRFSTSGIEKVFTVLKRITAGSLHGDNLCHLFKSAYLQKASLAAATRVLVNELFKNDGLIILDADDAALKKLAIPYFKNDLFKNEAFHSVNTTIKELSEKYKIQVNPREINLFYLTANDRNRIIARDDTYYVDNTQIEFTEEELINELKTNPQDFSPNVILRPLYQEVILPNICYIGGGGELAYWLQLKLYFKTAGVPFPLLKLRNMALITTEKQIKKLRKLDLSVSELFLTADELATNIVEKESTVNLNFTDQKTFLKQQFKELYDLAIETDKSFYGAVAAQERKQIKGLENLEKRLIKAQKRKLSDYINRAHKLQTDLFPNGSLQERHENMSFFLKDYGFQFVESLKKQLDPLNSDFTIIVLPDVISNS